MKHRGHSGFVLPAAEVARSILIPRYYDPELKVELDALSKRFNLVTLNELVRNRHVLHTHGDYVPKIHYGTGPHPYIRTSDLANWEIKASPKHGVPETVYSEYAPSQEVNCGDIFFVHEGTYLIGTVAMVTEYDGAILYQHHLAKFSVRDDAPFNAFYLLAALETPLVRRQIRSKQFSADIIDSVVGRLEEIIIPYPKDKSKLASIEKTVEAAVLGRARLRRELTQNCATLDAWLRGELSGNVEESLNSKTTGELTTTFLGGRRGFSSTVLNSSDMKNNVLLPRYYDPIVSSMQSKYENRCHLLTIGELESRGMISLATGDEIGRLNYGTGDIPFVRTSDFGSWELKREAKQGVSLAVYQLWEPKQGVLADDILLVRDGTYLVGSSVLVSEQDLPLLFCGGIYRIRSRNHNELPPALLFALLNTAFVGRQIRNKQFTRDVIDTLGQRLSEIVLPIPKKPRDSAAIAQRFGTAVRERVRLRASLNDLTQSMLEGAP